MVNFVRLPINTRNVVVLGQNGAAVKSQIVPVSRETSSLRRNLKGFAAYELVFEVSAGAG